jgi:very-short-patch-repair endonuclease
MPPYSRRPRDLEWQVFRGSDAIHSGLLTADQLRTGAWRRIRRDVYADARLELDHELACRAAWLTLPPDSVIAGPSAVFLDGVEHAAEFGHDVHVIRPAKASKYRQQRVRFHATDLSATETVAAGGLVRTSPPRTAWDIAQWLDVIAAVAVVDGLLAARLVNPGQLTGLITERRGLRGVRRAARAFDLADGGAQSRPESTLRVRFVLAGLPRPVTQHPVRLRNGRVVHPDIAWPAYRVGVEYDGTWHREDDQFHLDRKRLNQLIGAGWKVLHVTSRRLNHDFPGILREVTDALREGGWRA